MGEVRLEARDLLFAFGRGEPLFDGWSGAFDAGEVTAVTGPSGRGKSTLLHLLGLMVRAGGGSIRLDGMQTGGLCDAERAWLRCTRIGFVFQDAQLDSSRTVLDNVLETCLYRAEPRRASERHALDLLERFGVRHRADSRPTQISGGQAQRISLCRALLGKPGVLLADEPTGNLDAQSTSTVVTAFREAAESGASVVIATHDPSLVAQCDRVVRL